MKTERLILRPWTEEDAASLYKYAQNPNIGPIAGWPPHTSIENSREVIRDILSAPETYAVVLKETNEPIGSSRFYDYNENEKSVLIGYTFIGRKFWGNGYNKALKKLMMDHAFQYVDTIYFHIGAFNIRSLKAIEKLGATKIDEFEVEYYGEDSKLNYIYQIKK